MINKSHLIWIDLEMTGLNPDENRIIEIATVVTDQDLNLLAQGPVLAIHQPEQALKKMDEWNVKQHNSSGLITRVRHSTINEQEAESQTLEFLRQYVPAGASPMCGNSICMDKRFLYRYMPQLERYFHYRLLDVSTIKELAMRWAPSVYKNIKKESTHLALDDIKESIAELAYYRKHFFISLDNAE